jgi:hypothetical protein
MPEQKPSAPQPGENSENGTENKKGLSKEAWTAISAIAVAIIGGIFTVTNTLLDKKTSPSPSSSPSPSGSVSLPSPSSVPTFVPTVVLSPSLSAQRIAQDLEAVNIDFSDSKERDHLGNPFSKYPQFAGGCLKLLTNQKLRKKAHFDVIFWNYTEELGGKVTSDSPDGDLDTNILKAATVRAYNTRNGSNALSFGDIVEPKL